MLLMSEKKYTSLTGQDPNNILLTDIDFPEFCFHVFSKYYKLDLIFQICSNKLLKDAVRCLNQPR